jgi:NADPH2:quinone reductase
VSGPALEPGPHQLLAETQAVGLNFIEIHQREGAYPVQHPFTPGSEGMDVVAAAGSAVEGFGPVDRITTTQASRT